MWHHGFAKHSSLNEGNRKRAPHRQEPYKIQVLFGVEVVKLNHKTVEKAGNRREREREREVQVVEIR